MRLTAPAAMASVDTEPPPILRLDPGVVNRIAAGEVIQRPASAVKELVENSLDAGSSSVTVAVKDGGLKLIQITDNGHGIRREDLPILCERHTTSKLRAFEDLQSIRSMGFRGEALASLSFVAHLTVTSMPAHQSHGYRAEYRDGVLQGEPKPCAAVKGTQLTVEDLFYNVAARRKAFRSGNEEYARILDTISRFAVHHFRVSFSCKKHGEMRADLLTPGVAANPGQASASASEARDAGATPGAGLHAVEWPEAEQQQQLDAIRAVYGGSVARELLPVETRSEQGEEAGEAGEGPAAGDESLRTQPEGDTAPVAKAQFSMRAFASSANYSAKRTTFILFINDRLVECTALKRACEATYAAILPKASKPFIYMSLLMPPQNVDVNMHPTKKEVGFLNEEAIVDMVRRAVEAKLLSSNSTRTFYTQTSLALPAAAPASPALGSQTPARERDETQQRRSERGRRSETPEHRMVRTDSSNPSGRLLAYLTPLPRSSQLPGATASQLASQLDDATPNGALQEDSRTSQISTVVAGRGEEAPSDDVGRQVNAIRHAARQRRQARATPMERLTSVEELAEDLEAGAHPTLQDVVGKCTYVGLADAEYMLLQHETSLYLASIPSLSRELMYQQVLLGFGCLPVLELRPSAPVQDLLHLALQAEQHRQSHRLGCERRGEPSMGGSNRAGELSLKEDEIAEAVKVATELLVLKGEMLNEYFGICIQSTGPGAAALVSLPVLLDRHTPDLLRLPSFLLALANDVDWETEKGCFQSVARTLAQFYELGLPSSETSAEGHGELQESGRKRAKRAPSSPERATSTPDAASRDSGIPTPGAAAGSEGRAAQAEQAAAELGTLAADAEEAPAGKTSGPSAAYEWQVQHALVPALRSVLKPPRRMAQDGTFVKIAALENLYKVFERC